MINKKLTILFSLLVGYLGFEAKAQQINVALHKPVSVSSENKLYPSQNITDGIISRKSKWQAGTSKAPHILEIDLQKYCNINELIVHSGIADQEKTPEEMTQAAGFWSVKNFKMQYWDDANWTDFPKAEIHENRMVAAVFKFNPAITTFKIRLICDDGEAINIMEIEALGTIAANMPAPPTIEPTVKQTVIAKGPQKANVIVNNKVVGKTMKYIGYNQGYYFPGSNISGWLEYSNVNSLRVWASLNAFVPEKFVQVDKNLTTVEDFDNRKSALRASPENNQFLKWDALTPLYGQPDSSSTNAMVFNYALTELKRLKIDVVLQLGSTDFTDTWENKWKQWQRYYAIAYYAAKIGDVTMFAMQNEPNHKNSGPMKLDQWISGEQIVSDAIHCAVEDVNRKYNKNLRGKFVGPVTAGQNTDWWAAVAKNIKTDYHGKMVTANQLDLFSTHSYNSPAAGYENRINNIQKILSENHPEGKTLPVIYTEIGRWMNAYLIDKEETMDSPSLFTEWAGIYSNNMKNGGYGMWAFKFANTASSTYPRGIKSGHHFIWQGKRIVEDAYTNLALNRPVKASAANNLAQLITDGNKTDASTWQSGNTTDSEKWLEIDLGKEEELGSAVVYTGPADGVYTNPDRVKNFKLQYLNKDTWKDIAGTTEKDSKYTQLFDQFKQPIKTNKIRFLSTDQGNIKVREIKLFAKGDGPSASADFNVSGIQRTGEVVRLFAKGFKDERQLLETKTGITDSDLDTYTSFDEISGNYYMWLVQRGMSNCQLAIDISDLKIAAETPITAETVNGNQYGEVTNLIKLPATGKFDFNLLPQSVVLLTIPTSVNPSGSLLSPSANATVKGGKNAMQNFGSNKEMTVQLNAADPAKNEVAYIQFNLQGVQPATIKRSVLAINGRVDKGEVPYRLHVYAIPQQKAWDQKGINWNNALFLDSKEALINSVGQNAFIAGEIAFDTEEKYHYLDVSDIIKKHGNENLTFVVVRETRQLGDDEDKDRKVIISSNQSIHSPRLQIWK